MINRVYIERRQDNKSLVEVKFSGADARYIYEQSNNNKKAKENGEETGNRAGFDSLSPSEEQGRERGGEELLKIYSFFAGNQGKHREAAGQDSVEQEEAKLETFLSKNGRFDASKYKADIVAGGGSTEIVPGGVESQVIAVKTGSSRQDKNFLKIKEYESKRILESQ